MNNSIGIKVLGWLYIAEAFFTVIPKVFLVRLPAVAWDSTFPPDFLNVAIVESILGIFGLIGGIGILRFSRWARKFLIIVALGNILLFLTAPIFMILKFGKFSFISYLPIIAGFRFEILFFAATVFYLSNPGVRKQFR